MTKEQVIEADLGPLKPHHVILYRGDIKLLQQALLELPTKLAFRFEGLHGCDSLLAEDGDQTPRSEASEGSDEERVLITVERTFVHYQQRDVSESSAILERLENCKACFHFSKAKKDGCLFSWRRMLVGVVAPEALQHFICEDVLPGRDSTGRVDDFIEALRGGSRSDRLSPIMPTFCGKMCSVP